MAYFRCSSGSGNGAVLTVTYSAEFYNQTFTATNGVDTLNVFATSAGTVDIKVPSEGSWTVSCTISGDTYTSNPVVVDLSYATELVAIPKGSTVTPTDDIQTWLKCAGITDKAYTTLNEVLADTDTYTTLLGDSNACDYMARSTTWASTIVADADAMRLLGMYDYACDALLSDSTWASAICGSSYFESVLDIKVPTMTSDTTPTGTAFATSESSTTANKAWAIFDGNASTYAAKSSATSNEEAIGYYFDEAVEIKYVCYGLKLSVASNRTITVQYSDDGTSYTDAGSSTDNYNSTYKVTPIVLTSGTGSHRYWRIKVKDLSGGNWSYYGYELQFYGRHTTQTDIIVSAPSDTIYYMDNGSPVTLCTTDTDGIGSVDWSTLPTGNITLYSSVAKNPDDLTADYSKSIKVTKNKVEGYLMPDKALYWYGYKDALLQNISTANGWSRSGSWTGMTAPTYQTNYVSLKGSSSTTYSGIGSATSISLSGLNLVINPIALSSASRNGLVSVETTKALPSGTYPTDSNHAWATTTGIQKLALSPTENNYYPACISATNSQCDLYAMWYE